METKLLEFKNYFEKSSGTGLLILKESSLMTEVKQQLNQFGFKTIVNLSDIKDQTGSFVLYFNQSYFKYIYNIFKQISDGLSMIQTKNPIDLSDEIINVNVKDFRLLVVMSEEDSKYTQHIRGYDFINLAGMVEYLN